MRFDRLDSYNALPQLEAQIKELKEKSAPNNDKTIDELINQIAEQKRQIVKLSNQLEAILNESPAVPDGTHYPYGEEITLSGNTPCFGYVTSSQKDWICLVPMPQRLYGMQYVSGTLSYTLRGGDANTQSGTASTSQITYSTWGDCLYIRINKNVSFGTNNTAIGGYISGITIKLTPPPTE